jgi:hypothetical protein
MSLTNYKIAFDNAYEEVFQKVLVAKKSVANTRFQPNLKFGASVERFSYDISGVRVRTVTRGAASTIDTVSDSNELLTINLEKEAVFHISDGEVTQTGPLNPGEVIGAQVAIKVALDLDGRVFSEVTNAYQTFDNGDLTTLSSTGSSISLSSTTVPQMVSRMPAKLRRGANQEIMSNMIFVVDSFGASDVAQYLLGKNIDLAGSVFKNGYTGDISNAQVFVSEKLKSTAVLSIATTPTDGDTVTIGGVVFTFKTTLGSTAGNVAIGGSADAARLNLSELINAPGTTDAGQVALSAANQAIISDTLGLTAVDDAAGNTMTLTGVGSGRLVLAETLTDATDAWTKNYIHAYFGKKGAIDLVVQDISSVDMRQTPDRRGTNVFSSYLAGVKTFSDGAKKFLDVWITA